MIKSPDDVTRAVTAVMEQTTDPRLREIMVSLVAHLHGFVRDVKLTEAEFRAAAALVVQLGQQTNDNHNEVILIAGSLGVSSLVCLQNNGNNGQTETTQNLLGPFWRMHSPATANGQSIVRSPTEGAPLWVQARVVDTHDQPIADAEVDIWHSAPTGFYEHQAQAREQGQADMNLRGKFVTDDKGSFSFWSIKPSGYPIPTSGVVGQLLKAQNRHPMRPAHVHALIFKTGYKTLISQVYADDDAHLETDVQFGVTRALTGQFVEHHAPPPGKPDLQCPWYSLDFCFTMEAGLATLPRPPIK